MFGDLGHSVVIVLVLVLFNGKRVFHESEVVKGDLPSSGQRFDSTAHVVSFDEVVVASILMPFVMNVEDVVLSGSAAAW